jgi:SAP domain-containing ribonucleoprotein
LERAQKFGEDGGLTGLNGALPERSRKRGGDHRDDGRINKRRGRGDRNGGGRGRGGPRRDGAGGGGGQRREQGNENSSSGPGWMSQKDREAAEARKQRFAGES